MSTFAFFDYLPKDLQIEVYTFNPEHRVHMNQVCRELSLAHRHRWRYFALDTHVCDGYDCENQYVEGHDDPYEVELSFGRMHVFCCSYCHWDVMYDIKKGFRRGGGRLASYKERINDLLSHPTDCNCDYCYDEYYEYEDDDEEYYENNEL